MSDPKEPSPDLQRTAFDPELGKRIRAAESGMPPLLTPAPMGTARTEIGPISEPPTGETVTQSAGGRVKQFELIRELGRGGMGQVFLARDVRLGRLVALKFLGVRSPELVERFLVEARATARLQHENIVVLYEADEFDGQPYMALEYLEGEPLSRAIASGALSARRTVDILAQVARALVRAHESGIVHRDLKPDNIFVTRDGVVKVLDFGVAKLFAGDASDHVDPQLLADLPQATAMTQAGGLVGTMPYMSPEQWGADTVDHRTDLWAIGIIAWEMLTQRHPLDPLTPQKLWRAAATADPMPRIGEVLPDLPGELEGLVDRCLAKTRAARLGSARELLDGLERLMPGRYGRRLDEGESPFPGLAAFQEADADRFFGRGRDVQHMLQRLRDEPLLGVLGPSGVGKSSFLRAGVVPALKASGDAWEVLVTRPGRAPLATLATVLEPLTESSSVDVRGKIAEHAALVERLRTEPGFLGQFLRSRARQKKSRILLIVDQFEELYTLVGDTAERAAYTACLAGVADDASTPLRVVLSMRSDFLDRVTEDRQFIERLMRGLVVLAPIDREGMREALEQPLDMVGYRFESASIVEDMLATLAAAPAALPLLQFTAARLWDARDSQRKLLTAASYQAMGGVAGAMATHADEVLRALAPPQQKLCRAIFQRLVTADGTRAIVDLDELDHLGDPAEVRRLIEHLVGARLLVVQNRGADEGAAVEIVHESLIATWPTLRRWLEEDAEDAAFVEQLRTIARQWDAKGRPAGLLWTGEAGEEAQRFARRTKADLAPRERAYLTSVVDLATRAARRRRTAVGAGFAILVALVAAAAIALVYIRNAERRAVEQGTIAEKQRQVAEQEMSRAKAAEQRVSEQLDTINRQLTTIQEKEREREAAAEAAAKAAGEVAAGQEKLAMTYEQLQIALEEARREKARAEKSAAAAGDAAAREREARESADRLLAKERAKVEQLEEEKRRLSTKLK